MSIQKVSKAMIDSLSASKITGALPAIDGSALTGVGKYIKGTGDPTISTNPVGGVGTIWVNKTSGEMYVCTDATAGGNIWTNVGPGTGDVEPYHFAGEVSGFSSAGDPLTNLIERFSFASATSNAVSHGTLTQQRAAPGAASSNTHGYTLGGYIGPGTDMTHGRLIDKFQFNTNSNATTVGTLTTPARGNVGGNTSTTHGYSTGGTSTGYGAAATNVIDKFTFSADNNATTVGTLIVAKHNSSQQNSKTHGYTAGGTWSGSPGPYTNVIDKFSFITDGNATDVGDLPVTMAGSSGHGTSFHGYIAGGVWTGTGYHTRIDRISFSSDGNSVEYAADLHTGVGSASDQTSTTHGYISGNATNTTNRIQRYSFSSSATGTDVGDLTSANFYNAGTQY